MSHCAVYIQKEGPATQNMSGPLHFKQVPEIHSDL